MVDEFQISTDKDKLDVNFIHQYLSKKSYWAKGRRLELVEKSIENSLCFGVYDANEVQVAFARIATDYVVFAWLMDVFVIEKHQGKGIGKLIMDAIVNHEALTKVNGIGLRTNDAHALYEKFGFEKIENAETWMLRKKS